MSHLKSDTVISKAHFLIDKSITNFKQVRQGMALVGIKPRQIIISVILSVAAAISEAASIGLLIPLLRGLIEQDFTILRSYKILEVALGILPAAALGSNLGIFIALLSAILMAAILKNILRYSAAVYAASIVRQASHTLRQNIFTRYLQFGKLYFDRHSFGYLNQVLMSHTSTVIQPIGKINNLFNSLFSAFSYLALMTLISWQLTISMFLLIPATAAALYILITKIKAASQILANSLHGFGKETYNILSTIPLVKSYSYERTAAQRFSMFSKDVARLEFTITRGKELIGPVQEIISLIALVILISLTIILVRSGTVNPSPALFVYFYLVINLVTTYGSFHRFHGVVAAATGSYNELNQVFSDKDKFIAKDGLKPFHKLHNNIEFKDLSFYFSPGRTILNNLSLIIPAHKITALVGPTGAGKSTIINLILRYYDCPPNHLFVDGEDIRVFTSASWLKNVAVVSQDTQLFNSSLRNNIIYGLKHVDEKAIQNALAISRLSEFVTNLPDGLNTEIGDHGIQLSGGEKQRVSIARAILKKAELLILDEATSSLDSKTEQLIQAAIDNVVTGKTAIVIAHRLVTVKRADYIYVIDHGAVAEHGTLSQLQQQRGQFHDLWERQKIH